ncbi:MAG: FAD-binding protein [Thermoplasmataceae archaeon]
MKVLVFAKQIPDVNGIGFDPVTNRIIRENVPLQMNSFDRKGVEEAIRIKEKLGWETAVATMGPPSAADIINTSLRMGVDKGFLITDRAFVGSDTLVTSRILSSMVNYYGPDLVITGKYSLDGETSQVPPELSKLCGFSFISSVSRLEINGSTCIVDQDKERSVVTSKIQLPAVISVSEKINRARAVRPETPDMTARVEILDSGKLKVNISGVKDSPTIVSGTEKIESTRKVEYLEAGEETYKKILELISRRSGREDQPIILHQAIGEGEVLGIAASDPEVAMEIASKNADLARQDNLSTLMIGNIDPVDLNGMPVHRYIYANESHNECLADFIAQHIVKHKPRFVVFPSTIDGREIAAFVAADLGLGLTADCIDLKMENGKLIQYKPAFGGGIVARIYSRTDPAMATIRPGIFKKRISKEEFRLELPEFTCKPRIQRISETKVPAEYLPLTNSSVVLGVGKGIRKPDNVKPAMRLAMILNASLGATRPIVDFGWVPRQQQIGLTGTAISPDTYIAIGISGHDNHMVGTRYAGKIIAVNTDRNAQIFQYADFGIVEDAMDFIKGFTEYIETHR